MKNLGLLESVRYDNRYEICPRFSFEKSNLKYNLVVIKTKYLMTK